MKGRACFRQGSFLILASTLDEPCLRFMLHVSIDALIHSLRSRRRSLVRSKATVRDIHDRDVASTPELPVPSEVCTWSGGGSKFSKMAGSLEGRPSAQIIGLYLRNHLLLMARL